MANSIPTEELSADDSTAQLLIVHPIRPPTSITNI